MEDKIHARGIENASTSKSQEINGALKHSHQPSVKED